MKNLLFSVGLATFCIQAFAAQPQLNSVINCELAGPNHTASLLRSSPIEDSYVYKIRHDKQTRFMYDESTESRGSEVQWQCTSGEQYLNALVISGEFTSNFIQGVLFYFDSGDGKIERIDFAERNRPRWIKISGNGPEVIFENTGNESSHKYLSYGKNGAHFEFDKLPVTSSENVEKLIELNNFKP
ncbi:hypothetical protein [Pseudomonas sp. P9_31]|uniref:hypothetical protein n=1 Tax=Pseudomonas sp. P9_31 TaxID=3043448 RepID=UPI002A359376|nr:hypothetical protein [Pseudomonas sp. P9_31]WPN55493.1 hypothetical protein QMK51_14965 [Pseudomonas sp. P9_31]